MADEIAGDRKLPPASSAVKANTPEPCSNIYDDGAGYKDSQELDNTDL